MSEKCLVSLCCFHSGNGDNIWNRLITEIFNNVTPGCGEGGSDDYRRVDGGFGCHGHCAFHCCSDSVACGKGFDCCDSKGGYGDFAPAACRGCGY